MGFCWPFWHSQWLAITFRHTLDEFKRLSHLSDKQKVPGDHKAKTPRAIRAEGGARLAARGFVYLDKDR